MEKNIASHDISDMMVYEGMRFHSSRLYIKQKFAHMKKAADAAVRVLDQGGRFLKQRADASKRSAYSKPMHLGSTAAAVSAISIASTLITFFWLTLLLSPTL